MVAAYAPGSHPATAGKPGSTSSEYEAWEAASHRGVLSSDAWECSMECVPAVAAASGGEGVPASPAGMRRRGE